MSDEPYFRTTLVVEVLTAKEAWNGTLYDLAEDTSEEEAFAAVKLRTVETCSAGEMTDLLVDQGVEPGLLVPRRNELDDRLDAVENIGEMVRIAAELDVGEGAIVQSEYTRGVLDFIQELTGFNNSDDNDAAKRVLLERIRRYRTTN